MTENIRPQRPAYIAFACLFGLLSFLLMGYYLSNTIIHYTTSQQFPINSFIRFPLTLLVFPAELFSFCFALYFVYVLLEGQRRQPRPEPLADKGRTRVALLLPVFNEPEDVVRRTVEACTKVRWPGGTALYLLDDSTNEPDKESMRRIAQEFGCTLVRRKNDEGYKAGNINNAVRNAVSEQYFVILDADQAPEPEFLEETMDEFSDEKVGFVQTPQYFINDTTPIERAAKVGTNIFYQGQCLGKARDGALPFCGTNAVVRTAAFEAVNGFRYYSATEDIDLGLRMNDAGFVGAYVPKILARGYAPTDFRAYSSQQYRWANGNLAILRESLPRLLRGNYSLRQQVHTLFTLGWWLIGVVTLLYISVPLLSLLLNLGTHHTWLPSTLLLLLYLNVALGILLIYASLQGRLEGERVTLGDAILQYLLITNSAFIYTRAAFNALLGRYVGFVRTKKTRSATGYSLIKWNLLFSAVCFLASVYALYMGLRASDVQQLRTYLPISLWLLFYSVILASSIIFVGSKAEQPTTQQQASQRTTARAPQPRVLRSQAGRQRASAQSRTPSEVTPDA
jgi:cellulose synthase (UDP-forming)